MKLYLLTLLTFLGISILEANAQNSDIKNGDMEKWQVGSDLPIYWGAYYSYIEDGVFSQSNDSHSGKYAIRVDFIPQKQENRRFFSYPMNLQNGRYSINLYLKGKGDIRFVSLTKRYKEATSKDDEINVVGKPQISNFDSKTWMKFQLDFNISKPDNYQLYICVNSAEQLLIDDITLSKE